MGRLQGAGIGVDLPPGWEGEIDAGGRRQDGSVRRARAHLANFPLPAARGDYGGGAVERMRAGDALVVLLEFDPSSVDQALFRDRRMPRSLSPSDVGRDTLQRRIEGQGGVQAFFSEAGRAFCLYVVVGSFIDRADVLPEVGRVLETVEIGPW